MTIEAVKEKLWRKCGTSVNSMSLELYDDTAAKVSDISDNSRPLGFYSPQDGLVSYSFSSNMCSNERNVYQMLFCFSANVKIVCLSSKSC